MQFLYHQHWNKFFIETYDVFWKCLEFYFQITCTFHFATLLVSLLCFAGFFGESLLTLHAAKQILFFVITHILVIETCGFRIRTLLWLAAKIGFDEVPKVGGIKKSSCLAGGIFFFLHLLIRAMLQLTWQKKKQFRQLNGLCGYKNTDDVTRVKVYWKVWKCRM